jgi:hypothetical protein
VIYQDPLAYLLGLEGIALLDAWAGGHDRAFTDARLAQVRRLLDDEKLRDRGVLVERVSTVTAYEQQSAGYDAEAAAGCSRPTSRSWPSTSAAGSRAWRWMPHAGPAVSPGGGFPTASSALRSRTRAALSLGLQVRRCEEPDAVRPGGPLPEPAAEIGSWPDWPWSLMGYLPSAKRAAGPCPSLVIWHFQQPA